MEEELCTWLRKQSDRIKHAEPGETAMESDPTKFIDVRWRAHDGRCFIILMEVDQGITENRKEWPRFLDRTVEQAEIKETEAWIAAAPARHLWDKAVAI